MNLLFLLVASMAISMQTVFAQEQVDQDFAVEEPAVESPVDQVVDPTVAESPVPVQAPEDPMFKDFFEDIGYTSVDKRDPFLPYLSPAQRLSQSPDVPLEPLQRFALSQLKLVGIIWDVGVPKALIQDPSGKSHIILENTKMGEQMGYVAAIREGEVIVVEQLLDQEGRKSFQTKVLKLTASAVSQQ